MDLVPVFCVMEEVRLRGAMAVYGSQAELAAQVPEQWRGFLSRHEGVGGGAVFYGASPCSEDRRIHFLTGVGVADGGEVAGEEVLTLEAGEYAVVRVEDAERLRETWRWLLGSWLPGSGRRERSAPEFERYAGISEDGLPVAPVELWIPLEPVGG